ncbi:PKD domain-containing protein [Rufibacter quisquiliarum]|uniref:Gliding motility-associated-like protein n=1 Tax=Rufibacter quisquiliarum TaxID=1549639 RepID=A0A839GMR0_9BACT|nr:gliding motility-associated-like protein [Rufibacter quisquiliarum]
MKRKATVRWILSCLLLLFLPALSSAQSTSNKGRDFWLGYMAHYEGTRSQMNLYITSDRNAVVTVTIGTLSPTQHNVTANQVTIIPIRSQLAHVSSSEVIEQKAIHVTSDFPVVVYSHIYFTNKSAATLVLPSNTLGRSYYAISYDQLQNVQNADEATSQLMVVALEDNTTINITPTATTLRGNQAGVTFSPPRPLMKGELYQVRSKTDLTGTKIESVDTGMGSCKRIAVFSGSSWTAVPLDCPATLSGDNLYQQLYPISAWGKNFVTAPFLSRTAGDVFRVLASEDNTAITINGSRITRDKGEYHEFESKVANYVTADKPILFAQYAKTQSCDGVLADPEMTLVNPVEQTLTDITLYSSKDYQISRHYINVTMKTADTASFRLDGKRVTFTPIAANQNFVYSQNTVTTGNHSLKADSGFNAVAYGFGNVESYGYSAGANVNNLNQNITVLSDSICDGRDIRFKGFAVYQPLAWKWHFGDGTTSDEQNPTHRFQGVGTYTVSLVTTKSNGNDCDSQDSTYIEVEVHPNPVADFDFATVCTNDSTRFTDKSTVTTGETITHWRWDFGDGQTSTKQHPVHLYKKPGTYTVKLQIQTQAFCLTDVSKTITIFEPPALKFSASSTCDGKSMVFQNQTTVAVGNVVRWEWDFGDGTTSNEEHPRHLFPSHGTYTVRLKATSDQGCSEASSLVVTVDPVPVVRFSLPDICIKDKAVFQNTSSITSGSLRYLWDFGDGKGTSTDPQPQYRYTAEGIYTVKLVVTSDKGCKDSVAHTYTISGAVPIPDFTASSFCQEQGVEFKDASSIAFGNIVRWRWDFGDGRFSDEQNPKHTYPTAGTYTVKLRIWSGIVCTDSVTKTITVIPNPKAGFTTANVCEGELAQFTNTSTANGSGTLTYRWDFGDGKTSSALSPSHLYAAPGNYTVTLTVRGGNACEQVFSQAFTVYPTPKADFSPTVGCLANEVSFQDMSSLLTGRLVKWEWDFGDGISLQTQHPKHKYGRAGSFTVRLKVTSDKGCTHVVSKTVTITPTPVASAGADQLLCGQVTTPLAANAPAPATGLWTVVSGAGGTFSNPSNPKATFTGTMGETYTLRWTVSNSPCVSVQDEVVVKLRPTPAADAGKPVILVEGESTTLAGTGEGSLKWSPAYALSNPDIANPVASPMVTTKYYLHVMSEAGCPNIDSVEIKVLKKLQIPKAFSPNGDGTNDVWELGGIEDYPRITIDIYNRWGEKIYSTYGYPTPWDGKRNGQDLPIGAYYYIIDPHNGRPKFSGSLTILR